MTRQKLYKEYVAERINRDVGLWAPVKRQNNKMFTSANKTTDMKETKDLYGRRMVLARSNRDMDQKEEIGNKEFTLTPRALCAPDGSVLPCTNKSKLIHLLEQLASEKTVQSNSLQDEATEEDHLNHSERVSVVDEIVLVQKLTKKPAAIVIQRS